MDSSRPTTALVGDGPTPRDARHTPVAPSLSPRSDPRRDPPPPWHTSRVTPSELPLVRSGTVLRDHTCRRSVRQEWRSSKNAPVGVTLLQECPGRCGTPWARNAPAGVGVPWTHRPPTHGRVGPLSLGALGGVTRTGTRHWGGRRLPVCRESGLRRSGHPESKTSAPDLVGAIDGSGTGGS